MSFKINKFFVITCLLIGHVYSQDIKNSIPAIGDRVSGVVSLEQEKQIGTQFLKQIYAQAPLVNDALIQEFTELLIYKISETSLVKDRDFKLVIIDDRSLNAFAAPGGVIGVNAGLFIHAENEAQFASVIAHELAHVSQRHFARGILRGQDTNLASALVLISSIALAIISNNPGAFIAGPAALAQEQLRYSRIFEREADRFGFNNLINAGYDPRSMGEMFENMAKLRKLSGDLPPEFLLTHPEYRGIVKRIQSLKNYPYSEVQDNVLDKKTIPIDMLRFKLSFFGANRYDPKSDRWLRVSFFSGAPYLSDLNNKNVDEWGFATMNSY